MGWGGRKRLTHTQVTTLPSIAIALLMLVLTALVYVVARLRDFRQAEQPSRAARGGGAGVNVAELSAR